MAVGDDVPGIEEVDKSIGVGLTRARGRNLWAPLRLCCRRGMTREVAKANGASLENGAPQLVQFFRLDWLFHSTRCDEADAVLEITYLITQLLREDTLYLTARRERRGAILRIEALCHQVAAQEQHGCFVSGEAQGRQEVTFHQGVATARNRNDRHTSFS